MTNINYRKINDYSGFNTLTKPEQDELVIGFTDWITATGTTYPEYLRADLGRSTWRIATVAAAYSLVQEASEAEMHKVITYLADCHFRRANY